jgi:hypothetical protein
MNAQNEASDSLSHLSQELGLQLPRSTRVLGVLRSNGMDDAVRVELEIAASEFPFFLERTQIDRADLRPGTRGILGRTKTSGIPINPNPSAPARSPTPTPAPSTSASTTSAATRSSFT